MKPSQRFRLRRLAAEINGERGTWLAEAPPTWAWPAGKTLDPARKG